MNRVEQLKQIIAMVRNSNNPMAMLQTMAQSNPQINQVLQMCQGKNAEEVFYSMAQRMGVNPQEVLNLFK